MPAYKYQKKNKTMWYAKVYYQDAEGFNRQHCKRGFATKKEAEQYETDYKTALNLTDNPGAPQSLSELLQALLTAHNVTGNTPAETPPEPEKTPQRTFKDVCEEYWAITNDGLRDSTIETKSNMLYKHVSPYFNDYPLVDITPDIVRAWQNEMQNKRKKNGEKFSATYLHSIQSQLNAVLNYAVHKQYIPYSPMVELKNMGEKDAPPREIWTAEEYKKFSVFAKTRPETYMLFELYFWLGLRRGEGLAIRPCDVSYDARTQTTMLTIATSVDAKRRVGKTKTTSSFRMLALPDFLADELRTYMDGIYGLQPTDRIFAGITVNRLQRDIKWAIQESGVPDICIHGMRHSCASALIASEAGLTYTDVADILGHKSAKTTMNVYSHILPSTKASVANLIQNMHDELK